MTRLFVTWHDSRRSASLTRRLGLRRCVLVPYVSGGLRHVIGAFRTIALLIAERPREVWYQYSFALGLVLSVYVRLFPRICTSLIGDVHTKALRRDGGRLARPLVLTLKRWSLTACTAVLVTNLENRQFARHGLGVHAYVLPDPLPDVEVRADTRRAIADPWRGNAPTVFVCSFASDEPLELMAETGALLRGETAIMFTGDSRRLPRNMQERLSAAGQLLGFIPDSDYWELLRNARAIVVLTTQPACLPCGAYEAMAVGRRPVLLADERALVVFRGFAIFAAAEPTSLAKAIRVARGPQGRLGLQELADYEKRWRTWWEQLPEYVRSAIDFGR